MMADRSDALWKGLVAALIGYAVFALYFAIINVVEGRHVLYTVNALGAALFGRGSVQGPPSLEPVLAYNAVHLFVSIIVGVTASFLILQLERTPAVWYIIMFMFIMGLLYSVAVGGIVAREITGVVPWMHVVIVNVLAAVTAGSYLWRAHPRLGERVRRASD
jgi:hypothetical protein